MTLEWIPKAKQGAVFLKEQLTNVENSTQAIAECICSENQCNMTEAHDGHKRAQTQRERREKLSVSNLS